jgi:hypothetical protein
MTAPLPDVPEAPLLASPAAPAAAAGPQIRFYDNEVPAFAEAELERLYQCLMSTLARFDIYDAAPGASTYVVRENGQVTALFLFRHERNHVTVYNEQMPIPAADIRRFASAVFARYPEVSLISFYAIDTDPGAIGYPVQQRVCLEDIQMMLPASGDAYLSGLGKHTRANLMNGYRRLLRDFPSFRFEFFSGAAADEEQVRQLIALNKARMSEKQQTSVHTDRSTAQLYRLVQKYGVVGVATIDSRICGGAICFRVGSHYLLAVLAHDSRYSPFQLGKLCCYFSIRDAIERGCKQYHFGWGRFDYKYKMLGQLTELRLVEIYRSRPHMLRHAPRIAQIAVAAEVRKLKQRVARAQLGTGRTDRCIRSAASVARAAKRLLRGVSKLVGRT